MILEIDYASVDDDAAPDFVAAKAAGVSSVCIRRSYALHDTAHNAWRLAPDPCYARDAQRARDAGLVVGAYLFPTFAKGAPSPAEQVQNFMLAGGYVLGGQDMPPCLDIEFPGRGIADTGHTQAEVCALVELFITELRKGHGCSPLIYSSHVEMHDTNGLGVQNSPTTIAALSGCPLWVKIPYRLAARHALDQVAPRAPHYGGDPTDPADLYRVPSPWVGRGYVGLQFQGDVTGMPGFSTTVDASAVTTTRHGDTGPYVRWLQGACDAPVTGTYDDATVAAIKVAQAAENLTADGVVGPRTLARILWSQ